MNGALTRMAPLLPLVRALSDALTDDQLKVIEAATTKPDSIPGMVARIAKSLTGPGETKEHSVFLRCTFCGRPQEQFVSKGSD